MTATLRGHDRRPRPDLILGREGACPDPECGAAPRVRCNSYTGGTRTYNHPERHPLGEPVDGFIRDATPAEAADTYWPSGIPAGYRVGWFDALTPGYDLDWAPAPPGVKCRAVVGPGHRACGRAAVVTMRRGKQRWGYCGDPAHLYGRRYDPGPPPALFTARLYRAPTATPEVGAGT